MTSKLYQKKWSNKREVLMCTVNKCSVFKNMMIKNYLTRWSQEQVNSAQNISCQRSSQSQAKGYQNQKGRDKEKEEERSKENGLLGTHPRQSEKLLQPLLNALSFLKILFIFREGKGGRKRGRQTSMCGCLSLEPSTGDLAHNPVMCPDWELNQQPFGLKASTQSTEPHQPRLSFHFQSELISFAVLKILV